MLLGTPLYMAPEQILGERDIDPRADIWALGVILYECLAGVRPTQAENVGQIFKIVMTDAIKSLATVAPDLEPAICALVGRMLTRDRDRRPADLGAVAAELARHTTATTPTFVAARSISSETPGAPSPADVAAAVPIVVTPDGALDDTLEVKSGVRRAGRRSPITLRVDRDRGAGGGRGRRADPERARRSRPACESPAERAG